MPRKLEELDLAVQALEDRAAQPVAALTHVWVVVCEDPATGPESAEWKVAEVHQHRRRAEQAAEAMGVPFTVQRVEVQP